jgi:hypothetical protein
MVCDFSAPPFDPSVRYRLVEDRTTYAVGHDGTVWSRCSGEWKPLKPSPQKSGHLRVWLGGGRANMRFVHRLVLEAFVGPCPEGMSSSLHHDDDPSNNRLSNLSWGTQKDNYADAVRNGRIKVGDESPKAKLTSGEVLEIVRRCRGGERQADVARDFGIGVPNILAILSGRTWSATTGIARKGPTKAAKPKLTEELARQVFRRCRAGESQKDVANSLGVSRSNVWAIMHGVSWNRATGLPKVRRTGGERAYRPRNPESDNMLDRDRPQSLAA